MDTLVRQEGGSTHIELNVKKNVNTFGENVLGSRPQDGMGPRRSTVSSEFPSGIDRIANTHKYEQRAPPIPIPKSNDDQAARISAVNRKMGEMMAKCISLLENEIFPEPSASDSKQVENDTISKSEQDLQAVPDDEERTPSDQEAEQDVVANYDSNNSSVSGEKEDADDDTAKKPLQDDATIVMALAGLKHVRDVLLGKQAHFDSSVIDIKLDSSTPDSTSNGEDWKWDLVDHKEVASAASTPSSPPPPTIATKRASATIFVPPQTSSSLISADMDSPTFEKDTKPLPPIIQQPEEEKHHKPATVLEEPKLPQVPITYIPANPPPPKQQIKYRIEDLLSDPDLQLPSPKASANAKFKWMLENNESAATDKQPTLLSNHSTASATSSGGHGAGGSELFKSEQRLSHRKRSSFIVKKPVSDRASESTVDPLDAKNVDSRRSYEYDML